MFVRKRPNGKYKFEEGYKDPITGIRHTVSVTKDKNTAATRKQAMIELDDKIKERLSRIGTGVDHEHTVHDVVEAYLSDQSMTMRTSTVLVNRSSLRSIERIIGADTPIGKLTAPYVRDCLVRTGESAVTLNGRLKHLKPLITWAYETGYIEDKAWLDRLKRFHEDTTYYERIEDKYLEQEQLQELIKEMRVERWALLTRALALSGMRPGEFYALRPEDVDFNRGRIRIEYAYSQRSKEVTRPKTRSSIRDIRMQPELYKVMYAIQGEMSRQAKIYGYVPRDIYMCDTDGGYISHDAYCKYFRENCLRVLGREYTPYVLRHTHVSLLAAAGIPLETISRRVGHDSSKITKAVYMHVTERLRDREDKELDAVKIL